jgi:hypothetical protein
MDTNVLQEIAVNLVSSMPLAAILLYAWIQERRERVETTTRLLAVILRMAGKDIPPETLNEIK